MPFLAAFLSAFVIFPQAGDLTTKVKYSNPGAQAKAILADLSKATGTLLEVAPQTTGEILAVRFADIPLQDAMDRIAWAVDGSWEKTKAGYRLIRTAEQLRAEEQKQTDEYVAKYQRAIDARRKELSAQPEFTPSDAQKLAADLAPILKGFNPNDHSGRSYERLRALDSRGPFGRAIGRLSQLFDPNELANIEPNMKIVYSSQPTPTQRPMGQKAMDVVNQYLREQAVWSDVATKQRIENPKFGDTTYMLGSLTSATERLEGQMGKVLISVFKWSRDAMPLINFIIADKKGKILSETNDSLGGTEWMGESSQPTPPPAAPPKKIQSPPSALVFAKAWQSKNNDPVPSDMREKLLHPEKNEPIALGAGSVFLAIAQAKNLSMAVDLPDIVVANAPGGPDFVPEQYLQGTSYFLERQEAENWLLMRSRRPLIDRSQRMDRDAFGAYLRKVSAAGRASVDHEAYLAVHSGEEFTGTFRTIVQKVLNVPRTDYSDVSALRFYGSMTPGQRAAGQRDGVPISTFTPYQLQQLQKMLGGEYQTLRFDPSAEGRQSTPGEFELFYNGIYRQVTEALPSGPPATTVLKFTIDSHDVAQSDAIEFDGISYGDHKFTPQDYAWHKFAVERPDIFPWMKQENEHMDLDHLRYGSQKTYLFTFQFTKSLSLSTQIQESSIGSGPRIAYKDLPESFRKAVEEQLANYRKSYANTKGNGVITPPAQGGNIPPRSE